VEADREPLILRGQRGEIEYSEPRCHCRPCRRDFFPFAGRIQRPVRESVTPALLQKIVWAGANQPPTSGDATWIWQGEVVKVIDELTQRLSTSNASADELMLKASAAEDSVQRAITYYTNHQHRMNDPRYRQ